MRSVQPERTNGPSLRNFRDSTDCYTAGLLIILRASFCRTTRGVPHLGYSASRTTGDLWYHVRGKATFSWGKGNMEHKNVSQTLRTLCGLGIFLSCLLAGSASAGTKAQPGNSSSFGKSLAGWQELYQRWVWGDIAVPTDALGNAVIGKVVLLAVPQTPGDGTAGSLDVKLQPGQAFVLPFWGLLGTSYNDGTPNDPMVPLDLFQTLDLKVTLDGVTIVDRQNLTDYYYEFAFTPPIPIAFGNMDGIIWQQAVGFVHGPLTPGQHTLTLDAANTIPIPPNFGGGTMTWHNTWHVTVK